MTDDGRLTILFGKPYHWENRDGRLTLVKGWPLTDEEAAEAFKMLAGEET